MQIGGSGEINYSFSLGVRPIDLRLISLLRPHQKLAEKYLIQKIFIVFSRMKIQLKSNRIYNNARIICQILFNY